LGERRLVVDLDGQEALIMGKKKNRLPLYALDQLRIRRNVACLEAGDVE
jgi:hypothetical protein